MPYCHRRDRLPGEQPDPGLERPRLFRRLGGGGAQPALHQQLPGVHRPHLPRALRGGLHAEPREHAGHDQDDRAGDRRQGVGDGLDRSPSRRRRRPASASPSSAPGPAGLAAAQQLARVGHDVHVFEREPKAGGLLRYGIPDFKMEKHHIDRRVQQMEAEGVTFHYGVNVGVDEALRRARRRASTPCCWPAAPRIRAIPKLPGQELDGRAFRHALSSCSRTAASAARTSATSEPILAGGKHVVVIGGGDTASDCVGTSFRQGALSVTQLDIRPHAAGAARTSSRSGPTGRPRCAPRPARPKAPSASSRRRRSASKARTARSPACSCARVDEKR